jgi:hypothetical protein
MTVVQAGDAPGGGGQLPEFPGGGGGGQGAGPPPTLLPSQRSFHPLPATECHRSSGWQNEKSVFRIWIHRIHMFFWGLLNPDPSSKTNKKNLDSYCFVTSFGLFFFEKLCKCTFKK